jgi:DNA mismatch repair protein MutL
VHPTKREVKFRDEGRVFQAVRRAVEGAMRRYVPVSLEPAGAKDTSPIHDSGETSSRAEGTPFAGLVAVAVESTQMTLPSPSTKEVHEYAPAARLAPERVEEGGRDAFRESILEPEIPIWQLHDRYLLAPIRGGLVVIDQHAAHERVLYEDARARLLGDAAESQHLLFPRVVDVTAEELDRLILVEPHVRRLGYEISLFGEKQIAIRAVPAAVPEEAAVEALRSVLTGRDEHGSSDDPPEERVAKTFACHAAVRSGQALRPEERRALIDRLFATDLPHGDPHGRATYVRVSLEELDRRFGRR